MTEPRRLAQYVQPELSDVRLASQWARIRQCEPRSVAWRYRYVFAVATVAVVVGSVSVRFISRNDSVASGFVVERIASGEGRVSLPEGITVALTKAGKLELRARSASETILQLVQGEADFEVTHREGRRVIVSTPRCDIEVVGTTFHVAITESNGAVETAVQVHRGIVKVRSNETKGVRTQERRLTTGESWSSGATPPLPSALVSAPVAALMSATPDAEEPTAPQLVEITSTRSSAKELFESAERHRLAGQLREAATALDTLRRRYPGDPRAALAAFELGRIRMDSFGDFSGAMLAFNSALKLNPSASFREDAEARLIKLYERTGQREACKKAQQAYLARYPRGNHVGVVGNACGQ